MTARKLHWWFSREIAFDVGYGKHDDPFGPALHSIHFGFFSFNWFWTRR